MNALKDWFNKHVQIGNKLENNEVFVYQITIKRGWFSYTGTVGQEPMFTTLELAQEFVNVLARRGIDAHFMQLRMTKEQAKEVGILHSKRILESLPEPKGQYPR